MLPSEMLHALQHAGNYVVSAQRDGETVGATIGFFGHYEEQLHLHSHITGVSGNSQLASVGHALKLHQRAWCLDRGITTVTWTFDPMVRRNAYFNIAKLGAEVAVFRPNYYGVMTDGVNASDETDRVLVHWRLLDETSTTPAGAARLARKARPWLSVGVDQEPVVTETQDIGWCDIPDDFSALRLTDPPRARRWRHALRGTLGAALGEGGSVIGFSRDHGYLVRRT